jgi:hypothetical protein
MDDKTTPNRASNMEKAEGDRDPELGNQQGGDATDRGAAHPGITNRSDDEESNNQRRVPSRGDTKGDRHA